MPTISVAEMQKGQRGSTACTGHTDELLAFLREKVVGQPAVARFLSRQWILRRLILELGPCCWVPSGLSFLSS